MTDETIEPKGIEVNANKIIRGEYYRGLKNKDLFRVLCFTNIGSPSKHNPETVVYVRLHDNKWFSRPSYDWFSTMRLTIPTTEEYKK